MFEIEIDGHKVVPDLNSVEIQDRLRNARAAKHTGYCLCNPPSRLPLVIVKSPRGHHFCRRAVEARSDATPHTFGCRHFAYDAKALADRGLVPGVITVGDDGDLTVKLGELLTVSATTPSGEKEVSPPAPSSDEQTVETTNQDRLAKSLDLDALGDLLLRFSAQPTAGFGRSSKGFWERLRRGSENIRPAGKVTGKYGLSDLLVLPLEAGRNQMRANEAKLWEASKRNRKVLAAFSVKQSDLDSCLAIGSLSLSEQVGVQADLMKAAVSTCILPAHVDELRQGASLVMIASGGVTSDAAKGGRALKLTAARVMTRLPQGLGLDCAIRDNAPPKQRTMGPSPRAISSVAGQPVQPLGAATSAVSTATTLQGPASDLEKQICDALLKAGPKQVHELVSRFGEKYGARAVANAAFSLYSKRRVCAWYLAKDPRLARIKVRPVDRSVVATGLSVEDAVCAELLKSGPANVATLASALRRPREAIVEAGRILIASNRVYRFSFLKDSAFQSQY